MARSASIADTLTMYLSLPREPDSAIIDLSRPLMMNGASALTHCQRECSACKHVLQHAPRNGESGCHPADANASTKETSTRSERRARTNSWTRKRRARVTHVRWGCRESRAGGSALRGGPAESPAGDHRATTGPMHNDVDYTTHRCNVTAEVDRAIARRSVGIAHGPSGACLHFYRLGR
jgi:hypothetical protein